MGASGIGFAPGTAARVATTPTTVDLAVLYGGRNRLLRVAEVAEQLGVCNATVYRLCEDGELAHVRVTNSIRVRPQDLEAFIAARMPPVPVRSPRRTGRRDVPRVTPSRE